MQVGNRVNSVFRLCNLTERWYGEVSHGRESAGFKSR